MEIVWKSLSNNHAMALPCNMIIDHGYLVRAVADEYAWGSNSPLSRNDSTLRAALQSNSLAAGDRSSSHTSDVSAASGNAALEAALRSRQAALSTTTSVESAALSDAPTTSGGKLASVNSGGAAGSSSRDTASLETALKLDSSAHGSAADMPALDESGPSASAQQEAQLRAALGRQSAAADTMSQEDLEALEAAEVAAQQGEPEAANAAKKPTDKAAATLQSLERKLQLKQGVRRMSATMAGLNQQTPDNTQTGSQSDGTEAAAAGISHSPSAEEVVPEAGASGNSASQQQSPRPRVDSAVLAGLAPPDSVGAIAPGPQTVAAYYAGGGTGDEAIGKVALMAGQPGAAPNSRYIPSEVESEGTDSGNNQQEAARASPRRDAAASPARSSPCGPNNAGVKPAEALAPSDTQQGAGTPILPSQSSSARTDAAAAAASSGQAAGGSGLSPSTSSQPGQLPQSAAFSPGAYRSRDADSAYAAAGLKPGVDRRALGGSGKGSPPEKGARARLSSTIGPADAATIRRRIEELEEEAEIVRESGGQPAQELPQQLAQLEAQLVAATAQELHRAAPQSNAHQSPPPNSRPIILGNPARVVSPLGSGSINMQQQQLTGVLAPGPINDQSPLDPHQPASPMSGGSLQDDINALSSEMTGLEAIQRSYAAHALSASTSTASTPMARATPTRLSASELPVLQGASQRLQQQLSGAETSPPTAGSRSGELSPAVSRNSDGRHSPGPHSPAYAGSIAERSDIGVYSATTFSPIVNSMAGAMGSDMDATEYLDASANLGRPFGSRMLTDNDVGLDLRRQVLQGRAVIAGSSQLSAQGSAPVVSDQPLAAATVADAQASSLSSRRSSRGEAASAAASRSLSPDGTITEPDAAELKRSSQAAAEKAAAANSQYRTAAVDAVHKRNQLHHLRRSVEQLLLSHGEAAAAALLPEIEQLQRSLQQSEALAEDAERDSAAYGAESRLLAQRAAEAEQSSPQGRSSPPAPASVHHDGSSPPPPAAAAHCDTPEAAAADAAAEQHVKGLRSQLKEARHQVEQLQAEGDTAAAALLLPTVGALKQEFTAARSELRQSRELRRLSHAADLEDPQPSVTPLLPSSPRPASDPDLTVLRAQAGGAKQEALAAKRAAVTSAEHAQQLSAKHAKLQARAEQLARQGRSQEAAALAPKLAAVQQQLVAAEDEASHTLAIAEAKVQQAKQVRHQLRTSMEHVTLHGSLTSAPQPPPDRIPGILQRAAATGSMRGSRDGVRPGPAAITRAAAAAAAAAGTSYAGHAAASSRGPHRRQVDEASQPPCSALPASQPLQILQEQFAKVQGSRSGKAAAPATSGGAAAGTAAAPKPSQLKISIGPSAPALQHQVSYLSTDSESAQRRQLKVVRGAVTGKRATPEVPHWETKRHSSAQLLGAELAADGGSERRPGSGRDQQPVPRRSHHGQRALAASNSSSGVEFGHSSGRRIAGRPLATQFKDPAVGVHRHRGRSSGRFEAGHGSAYPGQRAPRRSHSSSVLDSSGSGRSGWSGPGSPRASRQRGKQHRARATSTSPPRGTHHHKSNSATEVALAAAVAAAMASMAPPRPASPPSNTPLPPKYAAISLEDQIAQLLTTRKHKLGSPRRSDGSQSGRPPPVLPLQLPTDDFHAQRAGSPPPRAQPADIDRDRGIPQAAPYSAMRTPSGSPRHQRPPVPPTQRRSVNKVAATAPHEGGEQPPGALVPASMTVEQYMTVLQTPAASQAGRPSDSSADPVPPPVIDSRAAAALRAAEQQLAPVAERAQEALRQARVRAEGMNVIGGGLNGRDLVADMPITATIGAIGHPGQRNAGAGASLSRTDVMGAVCKFRSVVSAFISK